MVDAAGAARTAGVRPRRGRDAAGRHDGSLLLPSESAEHEYRETDAADVARGVQESTPARRGVRCREVVPRYGSSRESRDRFCATRTPDRKSTRLNSSHLVISYAVFCLKKKNGN